jgi:site-specific DNA-methyltransferase (cytosine-N4-specific)
VQSLRESTVNVVRNGVPLADIQKQLPFGQNVPLPNRRCLRYGPHGIHEYRGKFFPQLVRSLVNLAGVQEGGVIADPMCGSGTTPVEVSLLGYTAIALDMNPLSVEIARTKCQLLSANADKLGYAYEDIKAKLIAGRPSRTSTKMPYFDTLPQRDQSYLKNWFSDQVLRDLDQIVVTIDLVQDLLSRNLMRIALSNILRRVSWQKEDDLRIRKEVRPDVEIDPIREFLEEIGRSVRAVLAFLRQNGQPKLGQVEINEGDARQAEQAWAKWIGKVDVIITSPPYATALPYIETDRLSLCYLSLLTRPEHRVRDDKMIGNREVTERGRMAYWALYERHRQLLPRSIQTLIDKIAKLNDNGDVGFRRRNLAALLAKYFLDLRAVLVAMAKLLKQGAIAYIVVGNNHTTAGAERVEIDTPSLLADLGELVGFQQGNHRSMQMLVSRDIFKKNAGTAEVILEMRRYT